MLALFKKKTPQTEAQPNAMPASEEFINKIPLLRSKRNKAHLGRLLLLLLGVLVVIGLGYEGWHYYQDYKQHHKKTPPPAQVKYPKGQLLPGKQIKDYEPVPLGPAGTASVPARTGR